MMNNLKRNAMILDVEQGINKDEEVIHRGFTSKL